MHDPEDPGAPPAERPVETTGGARLLTTRRTFLAAGAAGAAAAAVGLPAGAEAAGATRPGVRGPGELVLALRVNGASRRVTVTPATTLAAALRDGLGLTGTKIGCARGACGACTVLLDGEPFSACLVLALDVGEREVTTIEGLSRGEALHPLQHAFVEHDALQCGFCTPGMVMSCAALLAKNPSPTRDDVQQAVSGNTCRCGTYPKVFEAVLAAAAAGGGRTTEG